MGKRDVKDFVSRAESEIDSGWRELPIFQADRPSALLAVITATDDRARIGGFASQSFEEWFWWGVRFGQDVLHYAIPWIFEVCKCSNAPIPLSVDESQYKQGVDLSTYAGAYDAAVNGFTYYHQGSFTAFVAKRDPRITFAFSSDAAALAETEKRAYELYEDQDALERLPIEELKRPYFNLRDLTVKKSTKDGTDRVKLEIDDEFMAALRWAKDASLIIHSAQLEESQTFQGIPYGSYRQYYAALSVLSASHFYLHASPIVKDIEGGAVSSLSLRMQIPELNRLIAEISEVKPEEVALMSSLFVYDGSIANLDPICQPLILANEKEMIIPHVFVQGGRFERNLFKLLAKHPATTKEYQMFSSSKENIALPGLLSLLGDKGIAARRNASVVKNGKLVTDVDLLAFDPRDGCLLVIQHKWLIEPDTVNETRECDRQLSDGMKQVQEVKSTLVDQTYARRLLQDIPTQGYAHLEGLVVSRGFEPTGFVAESEAPVVTEKWFRRNLEMCSGLKALHDLAKSRPDRKELARGWESTQKSVKLAGYELRLPVLTKRAGSADNDL